MLFSKTYFSTQPIWEESDTIAFDELILSWNGIRPKQNTWTFWVSLHEGEWLKYAEWGPTNQRSFKSVGHFASSSQDVVIPKEVCTHFRIKVEGEELESLHRLNVCLSNSTHFAPTPPQNLPSVLLTNVLRQSQIALPHPRHRDLCSPTSLCNAINYPDPISMASRVYDEAFDIYGNWILNVAEGYNQTQSPCQVERLLDFSSLHAQLMKGKPVVVSVKGTIPGAPIPYNRGHLICVVGYDENKVHCIDPAFPNNDSTFVSYDLNDFLAAWGTRRHLAYTFLNIS